VFLHKDPYLLPYLSFILNLPFLLQRRRGEERGEEEEEEKEDQPDHAGL
jgi:hypothetical protein